ncbi:MAG: ATP-binding protein, partial [Pseudomonadota bacterium]
MWSRTGHAGPGRCPHAAGEKHCPLYRKQELAPIERIGSPSRESGPAVEWLLNGPDGCSCKVAGFRFQVACFSPFLFCLRNMIRILRKPSVHDLLAAHFAPAPLYELVITRRDFPHWMRPDLQRALEVLFAALPRHRFVGARLRDRAHDDFEISAAGLRVADLVPVRREDIVLPEEKLALIERNTLGFARETQQLVRLGLSARKGVLLYGPPGTGKTLIVRWLAGALEGFTKLIITADNYTLLPEYLDIARVLQPALVVLEDIDLVGGHRDGPWAAAGGVLNKLLNEMDGLAREA